MKDSQKRWKSNSTDSVIATLMGFDEPHFMPPPFHENHRVLSESYSRKVASIALRPGSLISIRRLCSTKNEIVQGSKGKNEIFLDECVNLSTSNVRTSARSSKPSDASFSVSLSRDIHEDKNSFCKKSKHSAARHVLRYQQKLNQDSHVGCHGMLGVDSVSNSLNFSLGKIDKRRFSSTSISGYKPKSLKVAYDHVKFDVHGKPRYREKGKSLMPESGKANHGSIHKEQAVDGIVSPRHSCITCTRNTNRVSQQIRHRSKFEDVLEPRCKNYRRDPHLLLDQSSLPNKSRNQNVGRGKTAKEVQEFGVSGRNQTLNEIPALIDKKSMAINSDVSLVRSGLCSPSSLQSRSFDSSSPSVFGSIDVVDDDSITRLPDFEYEAMKKIFSNGRNLRQDGYVAGNNKSKVETTSQEDIFESESGRSREQLQTSLVLDDAMSPSSKVSEFSICNFSCFGSSFNNPEAYIESVRDQIDNCYEYDSCKEIEPRQRNSKSSIGGEASLDEFSEDETVCSNSSYIGPPESLENLKRTNQQSPDSVLEQYDIKNHPSFECFDSIGLRLQLEALNFDSEETQSEGSVMAISGEEDSEKLLGGLSRNGRKVKIWLGDEESRNFSYLVDVLDEAGFNDTNSFLDFNTWASLECPVSPSVFDTLEKKYGKQTSWEKSERQLLFDRINSGLLRMFNPVTNFHTAATSMRRKLCSSFRRDEVEEELWKMLISQEGEKSKDLSEKALDQWLDSEDGISIICGELENSLFDDLVMELSSFWN